LVAVANRCYGISHQNKVSNIHHMSKRDAEKFIADLMTTEEAVGEVKSVAGSRASRSTSKSRKRKSTEAQEDNEDEEEEDVASNEKETDEEKEEVQDDISETSEMEEDA